MGASCWVTPPNTRIEGFLAAQEDIESFDVIYAPQGVLALRPPPTNPKTRLPISWQVARTG